jgi:hypothetical protein
MTLRRALVALGCVLVVINVAAAICGADAGELPTKSMLDSLFDYVASAETDNSQK